MVFGAPSHHAPVALPGGEGALVGIDLLHLSQKHGRNKRIVGEKKVPNPSGITSIGGLVKIQIMTRYDPFMFGFPLLLFGTSKCACALGKDKIGIRIGSPLPFPGSKGSRMDPQVRDSLIFTRAPSPISFGI